MLSAVLSLLLASAIVMGSPGPSTISVTAVGAAFGLRRSLRYAGGLILGTSVVLLAVAFGLTAALLAVPHGAQVFAAAAALYMLYLAFRIATAPPLAVTRNDLPAPALWGGLLLAVANPKAYLAIGAVFAQEPELGFLLKLGLLLGMIVLIHLAWLLAGAAFAEALRAPVAARVVNLLLAASLVVVTVAGLMH